MASPLHRLLPLFASLSLATALLRPATAQPQTAMPPSVAQAESTQAISLFEAEQRAATNRTVAVLSKAASAAAAEVDRVNVRPNPVLSGQLGNTLGGRYGLRETDRILRIEQLFERGNKQALRAETAGAQASAARQEITSAIREQRQGVVQAYFDLALAQSQAQLLQENLRDYERLVNAVNRRLLAGDVAAVDLSRLKVEAARAANELQQGQTQILRASIDLSQRINQDSNTSSLRARDPLPDSTDIQALADAALRDLTRQKQAAAEQRSELKAADARILAAQKNLDLARSLRTRDVSLGVQAERSPATEGTILAMSASIPLFVFNDFRGDIAKAQAELEQAELERARISLAIQNDIDQAALQVASARDRAQRLLRQALPSARQATDAIEFAFMKGAGTLTDLFDARRQYNSIRLEAETAKADVARALGLLRLSTWVEPQ